MPISRGSITRESRPEPYAKTKIRKLMQLGTGATVEKLTEELYLSIKDGSGHVKSTENLANFIRFASHCSRQRRSLLFKIVDLIVHAPKPKRWKDICIFPGDRHEPHDLILRTRWCRKNNCSRCIDVLEYEMEFPWIGPWTCPTLVSDEPMYHRPLGNVVDVTINECRCSRCFRAPFDRPIDDGNCLERRCEIESLDGEMDWIKTEFVAIQEETSASSFGHPAT